MLFARLYHHRHQFVAGYLALALWAIAATCGFAQDTGPARVFDARKLGAKGDGVTNDVAAIDDAFTAADAVDGSTLYFPPGTYLLDGQVTLSGLTNINVDAEGAVFIEDQRIAGGGTIYFSGCTNIKWKGGTYRGQDTQEALAAVVLANSPTVGEYDGLQRATVAFSSSVFKLVNNTAVSIDGITITGKERVAELVNNTDLKFLNVQATGVLIPGTMDPHWDYLTGDDTDGKGDKGVALWTYALQDYGTQIMTIQNCVMSRFAGLYVGGLTSNYNNTTMPQRFPRHISAIGNKVHDYFDNCFYVDGAFDFNIIGNEFWDNQMDSYFVKAHGDNFNIIGNTFRGGGNGVQFAGKGAPAGLDDQYAGGGNGLLMQGNKLINVWMFGVLLQSDGDSYPREVKILDNSFINCGQASALAFGEHPLGGPDGYGTTANHPIRLLAECGRIEFSGNTIDSSAGGAITSSLNAGDIDADYAGQLAFLLPNQLHRLDKRCYIKVEGHSVASYNTGGNAQTHYVEDIIEASSGASTKRYLVTTTTYSSAGTGGIWRINTPPWAVITTPVSSGTFNPTLYDFRCNHNTFINQRRGVLLHKIANGEFIGNRGVHLGGETTAAVNTAPALFCVDHCRTSLFKDNIVTPRGGKVIHVSQDGGASESIWSGNTVSGNVGAVITDGRSTDFMPSDLSECVAWWDASDTMEFLRAGTGDAWGDRRLTGDTLNDQDPVATWIDKIAGARMHQVRNDRRPLYRTNQLNSLSGFSFDGTDDFFRMFGDGSSAKQGTVYIVAEDERGGSSNYSGTLFASQSESNATPDIVFISQRTTSSDVRPRLRFRTGLNDIQSSTAGWADSTPRVYRFSSDAADYIIEQSNGSGAMTTISKTGSTDDGKWFYDADTASGVWRQSCSIGALLKNYQPNTSPAAAGDANTFFKGKIYEVIILDWDGTGTNLDADGGCPAIESYLFSKWGAL